MNLPDFISKITGQFDRVETALNNLNLSQARVTELEGIIAELPTKESFAELNKEKEDLIAEVAQLKEAAVITVDKVNAEAVNIIASAGHEPIAVIDPTSDTVKTAHQKYSEITDPQERLAYFQANKAAIFASAKVQIDNV